MNEQSRNARSLIARGPRDDGLRPYIEETVAVEVRFEEVDSLNIVWHGGYTGYFELARRAFGRRFGIDYDTLVENGTGLPVVHLRIDYLAPARLMDKLAVTARLLRSKAARLDFDYEVRRQADGVLLAVGATSQVFATLEGELMLTWPGFMEEARSRWEGLWVEP